MPSPPRLPFRLALLEEPGERINTLVGNMAGGVEKLAGRF